MYYFTTIIARAKSYHYRYHFGPVTQAGNDFKNSFLGYEEGFGKPFAKYVTNCFREYSRFIIFYHLTSLWIAPDVRRARVLGCEDTLRPVNPEDIVVSNHYESLANTSSDLLRIANRSISPTAITLPPLPPTSPSVQPILPPVSPTLRLPSNFLNALDICSVSPNTPSPSAIPFTPSDPTSPIENGIAQMMTIPDSNIDPILLSDGCPSSDTAVPAFGPQTPTPAFAPSLDLDDVLSAPIHILDAIIDTANEASDEALNEALNDARDRLTTSAAADYHIAGAVVKTALASQASSSNDASGSKPSPPHQKRPISATSDNSDDTALNPAPKRAATITRKRAGGMSLGVDEATESRDPEGSGANKVATQRVRHGTKNLDRANVVRSRVGTRSQVSAEKPTKRITRRGGRK